MRQDLNMLRDRIESGSGGGVEPRRFTRDETMKKNRRPVLFVGRRIDMIMRVFYVQLVHFIIIEAIS
jgi:hypothetical protein